MGADVLAINKAIDKQAMVEQMLFGGPVASLELRVEEIIVVGLEVVEAPVKFFEVVKGGFLALA